MSERVVEEVEAPAAAKLPHFVPKFSMLDVDLLDANPLNPRSRSKPDPELVGSIRDRGLLQPIVAQRAEAHANRYLVLAGHRRLAAVRELGWPKIAAMVLEVGGDDAPGLVLLAENSVRRDLSPLDEADVVAQLLEGSTHSAVAAAVGKSVGWVARRANLLNLSPAAKAAARDGSLKHWPPLWLEELALLAPKAQDDFLEHGGVEFSKKGAADFDGFRDYSSVDELREDVRERLRPVRLAIWDPADARLVPSVGACVGCAKNCVPGDALAEGRDDLGVPAGDATLGTCRDVICWNGKKDAYLARRFAEAKKEHGQRLLTVEGKNASHLELFRPSGDKPEHERDALNSYAWKPASKAKGRPALVVTGPKAGDVVFVEKLHGDGSAHSSSGSTRKPKPTEKELARRLELQREHHVLNQLGQAVSTLEWAEVAVPKGLPCRKLSSDLLLQLLARARVDLFFGDGGGDERPYLKIAGGKGRWPGTPPLLEVLWGDLRQDFASELCRPFSPYGEARGLEDYQWVVELAEFDVKAAQRAALLAFPDAPAKKPAKVKP